MKFFKKVLIVSAILGFAWFSILKVQSYVIGIYTAIPESSAEAFHNYQTHLAKMYQNIDSYTWEEFKNDEKQKLFYEAKIAGIARKIVDRLLQANQIGK